MPLYAGELNVRRAAPLAEYPAPLAEVLRAQSQQTQHENPTRALSRLNELNAAEMGDVVDLGDPTQGTQTIYAPPTMLDAATARTRVADEGLQLLIPNDGIAEKALDILLKRKREELQRQNVMSRGPDGVGAGAARLGVALYESLFDPLNIASAFIPVVGPARYTRMLAGASSALGRAGVRAGVGAAEGAVGAAMLEPFVYSAAQAEQADYHMTDSLLNVGFGAVFGGALHVGAGAARDWMQPGWWRETPEGRSPLEAASIARRVEPETRDAALRVSVAQAVEGRSTDVDALVRSDAEGRNAADGDADPAITRARESNVFSYDSGASTYGRLQGFPQRAGTPVDKLFANFADNATEDSLPKFRAAMLARANADPKQFANDGVLTMERALTGGLTVRVEAAQRGNTRVQMLDGENVVAAARIEHGMIDSIAVAEQAKGGGIGRALLRFLDEERIANVAEVPDRSPGFVSIQKAVLSERALRSSQPTTPAQVHAAAQQNATTVRSAEPDASRNAADTAKSQPSPDLKAAVQELDNAVDAAQDFAGAMGVKLDLAKLDSGIQRAEAYAVALKAAAVCGLA